MAAYIGGCDISEYQGDIDWNAFRPGTNFVIIKATEGNAYVDKKFHQNQPQARAIAGDTGIGYYHYADGGDPVAEANHFIDTLGPLEANEVLALDWEIAHPDPVGWCVSFIQTVKARTGVTPLFYTNQNRVISYNWSPVVAEGCGLWVAHYGYTQDEDVPIKWWPFYVIHQTGSSGSFPGIGGRVDVDYAFATLDQFRAYGFQASNPAPTPVDPPTPPPATTTTTTTTTTLPPIPDPTQPDYGKENNGLLKQILAIVQFIKDKILSVFK